MRSLDMGGDKRGRERNMLPIGARGGMGKKYLFRLTVFFNLLLDSEEDFWIDHCRRILSVHDP